MAFETKMYDLSGREVEIDIQLDLIGAVSAETDDELIQYENGDLIKVVIYGPESIFGAPIVANILLEVLQFNNIGAKTLTIKEIGGGF